MSGWRNLAARESERKDTPAMKILCVGGYGNISWSCSTLAREHGHEVWLLKRAETRKTRRPPPDGVGEIHADVRSPVAVAAALAGKTFDTVVDFICFDADQARNAVSLFEGRTGHYVFISSDVVYERKTRNLPFTEDCPKGDPAVTDAYVAGKILAEEVFLAAWRENSFPVTIVRPGYTYDTIVPVAVGGNCFTVPSRYLAGKPALIMGDGIPLRTATHSSDFAAALVGLLGNSAAIGEAFHIAGDEWLTWNDMTDMLLDALGVRNPRIVHISTADVLASKLNRQPTVLAQKAWHNIFDNTKIKRFVPGWKAKIRFAEGIRRTLDWLYENDVHRRFDPALDAVLEELTQKYA